MNRFSAKRVLRTQFVLLPLLVLFLFGCCGQKQAENPVEKRQEAIANEIVSIQYDFSDSFFHINDANAVSLLTKTESLTNRLDKISKELDTVGRFPLDLRKATLKKMDDHEKILAKSFPKFEQDSLKPETLKTMETILQKFTSASLAVAMKAGLYYNGTDTNGVDIKDLP